MLTIVNAERKDENQVGNNNIARFPLESRSFLELSQNFAVSGVGASTPEDSKQCGMFNNYGILEIIDAPEEKYGQGPHFVMIEKDFVPRIEFSKLVSKGLQVQTPTMFYGETNLPTTKNSRNSRSRLQNLIISETLKSRLLFGTLIGKIVYEAKLKERLAKLYAKFYCLPMVILPTHIRFANLHTGTLKKKFSSPFCSAETENSLLLMQSMPAAEKPVQLTYQIKLCTDLIIIGQVTMEEMRASVRQVYEDIKGFSDDDFDVDDTEDDDEEFED